MNMVFCRGCGKEIHETAPFCPHCGAAQQLSASQAGASKGAETITEPWITKFALIDKAGGVKMPGLKDLPFNERSKVIFNIWGFLFGPIYYCVKGMWKKAISLLAVCVAVVLVLELICKALGFPDSITNFVAAAVFATRANIDFYKKVKLGENGWW